MSTETTYDAQALARVEAKLRKLTEQLDELSARGEEMSYMLGWAQGGIKAALTEIDVWREVSA